MTDLDDQLSSIVKSLPHAVELEASRIAGFTVPTRFRAGRGIRPRWVLPVVVGAAVALTGAGTATVAILHWGGVSMPADNVRNTEPIPVNWTTETGHQETCRVWVELRNPQSEDANALDAAVDARDWSGVGQQLYDDSGPSAEDPDGEARITAGLGPVLQRFTIDTFPDIGWLNDAEQVDGRAVDAWGMSCDPEAL